MIMRTYRKRPWAALSVNMTPLIDVVFLIIIFFIIMINFSENHLKKVNLPKSDEAEASSIMKKTKIHLTVKSQDEIFFERKRITLENLPAVFKNKLFNPKGITIQIRADKDVTYDVIKEIMIKAALNHINKIEFSTCIEE